jgi:serine/threonine-protein kinase
VTDHLLDRVTVAVGSHYLIEGEIGRGGMAVVYRAVDLRLHRSVALKVLPPELAFNGEVRTRFIREAQTAAQLTHPNIVPIYAVDERDGIVYFVMALVEGQSVGAHLSAEGRWAPERAIRVLRDVADALAYAHGRGVIHRDIKPDNILIERATGRPLVTDFGIARAAAGEARITLTGVTVGTPTYMSPEQALGERELDGRSDIYSLGIVGYQMLAGEPPFRAVNTPAMLLKHIQERPRPIRERNPEVPQYLAVAIDRALSKRPEDRWSTATELRDALIGAATPPPRSQADRASPSASLAHFGAPASSPAAPPVAPPVAPLEPLRPSMPVFPDPPAGLTKGELRRWHKTQRKLALRHHAELIADDYDSRPLERRVIAFRRSAVRFAVFTPILFGVNLSMEGIPWFILPSALMMLDVLRKGGSIWSDGVGPIDAFKKGIRARLRATHPAPPTYVPPPFESPRPLPLAAGPVPAATAVPEPLALAPRDVVAGNYGESVRRAAVDRAMVRDIVAGLRPYERDLIPDVIPTVDALAERVGALATTLHRLDADVSGSSLGALDSRIAALESEPATADRERRLSLLQRQRKSLHDLLDRRRALSNQLESASLSLQNLKLDLLKLRSSGVGAAVEDVTSATQEARALSRDIGHVLDAADDIRQL